MWDTYHFSKSLFAAGNAGHCPVPRRIAKVFRKWIRRCSPFPKETEFLHSSSESKLSAKSEAQKMPSPNRSFLLKEDATGKCSKKAFNWELEQSFCAFQTCVLLNFQSPMQVARLQRLLMWRQETSKSGNHWKPRCCFNLPKPQCKWSEIEKLSGKSAIKLKNVGVFSKVPNLQNESSQILRTIPSAEARRSCTKIGCSFQTGAIKRSFCPFEVATGRKVQSPATGAKLETSLKSSQTARQKIPSLFFSFLWSSSEVLQNSAAAEPELGVGGSACVLCIGAAGAAGPG